MAAGSIVWFRQDLRLADNPALAAAVARGAPLICLYILDEDTPARWRPGGAARWWLHHSLAALGKDLKSRGARLVLRRGSAANILLKLQEETGADAVFWNRCHDPHAIKRDSALKAELNARSITAQSFNGALLAEPWDITTKTGTPFKVFTPFWRKLQAKGPPPAPLPPPQRLASLSPVPQTDDLPAWGLLPTRPDWALGFAPVWTPGEAGAEAALDRFLSQRLTHYYADRGRPDKDATSRLSPHLHFGEISPRRIWHAALAAGGDGEAVWKFLSEVAWREFSHHLLFHFPSLPDANWRPQFDRFPWAGAPAHLRAWQHGETGYPIVDAGMRELWATGYMHNRVRMIAASFLVKDLLIDWRKGQDWFWDTLVDADLANNAAGWQWVAGSGADAAPYFRIFNPVAQGEKFDPHGAYVRRWLPEISGLPDALLHKPWEAPATALAEAGIVLGKTYPRPIVDHKEARRAALAAFETIKEPA